MANVFGGPTSTSALLTGLGSSLMNQLSENYKSEREQEQKDKLMDYEILMRAMETMKEDLTPSQVTEILTRGVDIFKPKGHGGIKENIKNIFGGMQPHQMEGGQILQDVTKKPRLNVQAPTQTATPGGTGADQIRARTVTVPPPPQSKPELTYREQHMEDEATKQGLMLQRQLAMEDEREKHRQADIKLRTEEAVKRVAQTLPMQERWKAERKVSEKAYQIAMSSGRSVDDPEVVKQAADEIQYESQMRKEDHLAKLENYKQRNEKMKADIQAANARIDIARQHLSASQQKSYKELPQIKQADIEINKLMNESQRMRILAGQAWGNYAETGNAQFKQQAEQMDAEAEQYETEAKTKVAFKENYIKWYEGGGTRPDATPTSPKGGKGGVKLPNAPGRSSTKLTVAEATAGLRKLHPEWSSDQINSAIEAEKRKPNSRIAQ